MPKLINPRPDRASWWRDAVVYQIYIRSFADGNGDGIGDIAGIRQHLPYLRDLGVEALWVTPWYMSPMADGGYEVADYRSVDPMFGTLDDADGLLADAHALGLRVLIDIVPNHTSDRHPWFQEALASAPGSVARSRYHFAEGLGEHGHARLAGVGLPVPGRGAGTVPRPSNGSGAHLEPCGSVAATESRARSTSRRRCSGCRPRERRSLPPSRTRAFYRPTLRPGTSTRSGR